MGGAGPACSLPDRQLGPQQKSRPEPGSLPGRGKQPLPFARRVREDCRGRTAPRKGWSPFAAEMLSLAPSCLAFGHLGSGRYDAPLSLASREFPEVRGLLSEYLYCNKLRRCPGGGMIPHLCFRSFLPFAQTLELPGQYLSLTPRDSDVMGLGLDIRIFQSSPDNSNIEPKAEKHHLCSKLNSPGIPRSHPLFSILL